MNFAGPELEVIDACFAYAMKRREALKPNTRIAYYTTAETALKIIQDKTFWLRSPQLMNDYTEVVHGQQCLKSVLTDPDVTGRAEQTVNAVYPGFFAELVTSWEKPVGYDRPMPFVACLSEIDAADDMGRLSMWRAYGGTNGVALVMKDSLLDLDSSFINTFHSPVLYGGPDKVKEQIIGILDNLESVKGSVAAVGKAFLLERILLALVFAELSIKHVGFGDEKEWRMVHHLAHPTEHVSYRSQVVRGNAEVVCQLNLASHPALAPDAIIEKVIIGPCAFPASTAQAVGLAFYSTEMPIPKIVQSDIPLRHF